MNVTSGNKKISPPKKTGKKNFVCLKCDGSLMEGVVDKLKKYNTTIGKSFIFLLLL